MRERAEIIGNKAATVKLYDRQDGQFVLVDEIEATHVGCEYGEDYCFNSLSRLSI